MLCLEGPPIDSVREYPWSHFRFRHTFAGKDVQRAQNQVNEALCLWDPFQIRKQYPLSGVVSKLPQINTAAADQY